MEQLGYFENILRNHPTVISTTLAAIVAFFVAVIGIKKQRQTSKEKNSLDFEASYKNNKDIRDAWTTIWIVKELEPDHLIRLVWDRKAPYRKDIVLILNEWERASNAIFHDLYDENLLYKAYGTTVIKLFQGVAPFIQECQRTNPRVFVSFTKLAVRWQIRRAIEDEHDISEQLSLSLKELHTASVNFSLKLNNAYATHKSDKTHIANLQARKSDFQRAFKRIK